MAGDPDGDPDPGGGRAGTLLADAAGAKASACAALCAGESVPGTAAGSRPPATTGSTIAGGLCATAAVEGFDPVMRSGCWINKDSPIPKKAAIVAAAAIPSPPSDRIVPTPRLAAMEPGSESAAAVDGVSAI